MTRVLTRCLGLVTKCRTKHKSIGTNLLHNTVDRLHHTVADVLTDLGVRLARMQMTTNEAQGTVNTTTSSSTFNRVRHGTKIKFESQIVYGVHKASLFLRCPRSLLLAPILLGTAHADDAASSADTM